MRFAPYVRTALEFDVGVDDAEKRGFGRASGASLEDEANDLPCP